MTQRRHDTACGSPAANLCRSLKRFLLRRRTEWRILGPRNAKCRRVCQEFSERVFTPQEKPEEFITLNVDELEAIRLCDLEGLDQEEAAGRMGVSRGTFQRMLYSGRNKSAEALCMGKGLVIAGGNYEVATTHCKCGKSCRSCPQELKGRMGGQSMPENCKKA